MLLTPLLSIAIPTYNRLATLQKAVASALQQTYANIEIVILNNASNDGTKAWIDELALKHSTIKVVHNAENIGMVKNIQSIPQHISGAYLVVLSDDDWLEPDFASEAVKDFATNDQAVVWYCRANIIYVDRGYQATTLSAPEVEDGVQYVHNFLKGKRETTFCATVYKISELRSIGGFIGNSYTLDASSRLLCAAKGLILFNPKILANYTFYQGNATTVCSLVDWIRANEELYDLVENNLGKCFRYSCAFCSAILFEYVLITFGMRNALSCALKFFHKYHYYFILALVARAPIIVIKILLPHRIGRKIRQAIYYCGNALCFKKF